MEAREKFMLSLDKQHCLATLFFSIQAKCMYIITVFLEFFLLNV